MSTYISSFLIVKKNTHFPTCSIDLAVFIVLPHATADYIHIL